MQRFPRLFPLCLTLLLAGCYSGGGQGPTRLTAGSDECNSSMVLHAAVELYRSGGGYKGHSGAQEFTHPAAFDCESYALYQVDSLTLSSGMGIHLLRGPRFRALATAPGAPADLNQNGTNLDEVRDQWMEELVTLTQAQPLQGAFPTIAEFHRGNPCYGQEVDLLLHEQDLTSLRWSRSDMQKVITPETVGRAMLAQLLTARGRLAVIREEWTLSGLVQYFGDIPAEGMKGLIALHAAWDKARFLLERLGWDGVSLGPVDPLTYDPATRPIWFPARVQVEEQDSPIAGLPPEITGLTVTDGSSTLAGTSAILRGALELYWLASTTNPIGNYRELFDGDPFPRESEANSPGALAAGLIKVCLANLYALHFQDGAGTLVDTNLGGAPLRTVTITDMATTLRVLAETVQVLPGLSTVEELVRRQGDFLRNHLFHPGSGLAYPGFDLDQGPIGNPDDLVSQLAAIEALLSCYQVLDEPDYLTRALNLATMVERDFLITDLDLFRSNRSSNLITWSPASTAWLAAAMRAVTVEGLYPGAGDLFGKVHPSIFSRLQLLLAENSLTGERIGDGIADTDGDGILETLKAGGLYGMAPILAERRELLFTTLPGGGSATPGPSVSVTWAQDILPLFSTNCSSCHMGVNNNGGLDLSTYSSALRGGSSQALFPIVVPYQATQSLLYLKLILDTPPVGTRMPYLTAFPLTAAETRLVRDWINQGAHEN